MVDDRIYAIIAYDVTNDKRRNRLFKLLSSYGARYQYSIFEVHLSPTKLLELEFEMRRLLNLHEDKACIIMLCQRCIERRKFLGEHLDEVLEDVLIV